MVVQNDRTCSCYPSINSYLLYAIIVAHCTKKWVGGGVYGWGGQKTTALEAKLNSSTLTHKTTVNAGQSVK